VTYRTEPLGDIATIEREGVDPGRMQGGARYVGLEHIDSTGALQNVSVENGELASTKFSFTPDHILFGKLRPYLRKIARPDFSGICSTDIIPIRPGAKVDRGYLFHFLRQDEVVDKAASLATGINLPRLSPRILETFVVPLPPLNEQRRIAAILDEADDLRRQRRGTIDKLNTLCASIFVDSFGDPAINRNAWPKRTLGSLSTRFSDGPFGSNLKSEHYVEKGVRVIRLQNIGVGEFIDDDKAFISESHFEKLKKHTCLPGDVLIGTLGDPNLRAVIQPGHILLALNKADCVQMRVNSTICSPEYISELLNNPSVEAMAQDRVMGQTRLRISMGRLRELSVPVPPLDLQRAFAARIAQIDKLKAHHRAHLAKLGVLFASLQHRAFAGEL